MYSYGGHQTYTTYQQPTYTYYTRPAFNTSYTYPTSSPPRPARPDHGYAYSRPPEYTYSQYQYDYDYDEPSRQHPSYAERMRRNDRRPSDDYYYRRASPQGRSQYQPQYRKEDVYGYDYSPRGSPPPPYQDDESEYEELRRGDRRRKEDFYEEDVKSTRYKTYTYTKAEKTTSSEKKEKEGTVPKRTTSTKSAKPTTNAKPTTSSKSKFRTSFFSFSSSKPSKPQPQPQSQPQDSPPKRTSSTRNAQSNKPPRPQATPTDARLHSIPPGYSLKNWDPTLRPLILLGSVFDANSLGKWIYDWTVYTYTAHSVFADIAAELWLALIGLAGRCQRGERWVVRAASSRGSKGSGRAKDKDVKLVEEFLTASERLWTRLESILEACEGWMYKAARREGRRVDERTGRVLEMGKESGVEFVESVFGVQREGERTERLVAAVGLWTKRWDGNCEGVVGGGL